MSYRYNYHQDADILEVFFTEQEATASVSLTSDIILHFQAEECQAVSLIFNNFSHISRQVEYGAPALRLSVKQWPEQLETSVWHILAQTPVNDLLTISTYRSPRMLHAVPLAVMRTNTLQIA